jgi:16S rRNA processing protein RimM
MNKIPDGWIEIGTIVAPQGIKGELRVLSQSDFPERFEVPGERWLLAPKQTVPEPTQLLKGYGIPGKNLYVITLDQISDRDQAESLRGYTILVPETSRPKLQKGEYLARDLLNIPVYLQSTGELIGVVIDVVDAGNDLLVIKPPIMDRKNLYIPLVPEIVPVIDFNGKRIEVNPPPGLLELNN